MTKAIRNISLIIILALIILAVLINRRYAIEVKVLLYHHILPKERDSFLNNASVIDLEDFEEQMMYLYENKYNVISIRELEQFLQLKKRLPKKSVVITFDDGYLSNYHYAYPILKRYNFSGAIFLITSLVNNENENFNGDLLQYLSWQNIDEMSDIIEWGNHTHDLHYIDESGTSFLLTRSVEVVDNDLKKNMRLTKSAYFSYVYGQYNDETINILKENNIILSFTTKPGPVTRKDSIFELNRYIIYPNTNIEEFKSLLEH